MNLDAVWIEAGMRREDPAAWVGEIRGQRVVAMRMYRPPHRHGDNGWWVSVDGDQVGRYLPESEAARMVRDLASGAAVVEPKRHAMAVSA